MVSEGGCLYTLERLEDAQTRGAKIYGELGGYCVNSDASDYVLPNPTRQAECVRRAIAHAGLTPRDIHIVNTHATATPQGDMLVVVTNKTSWHAVGEQIGCVLVLARMAPTAVETANHVELVLSSGPISMKQ